MATRRGEDFYVVVNGATKQGDIAFMERPLGEHVVIDQGGPQALLALQGPRAAEVLEDMIPGVSELSFMEGAAFLGWAAACGSAAPGTRARIGSRFPCPQWRSRSWPMRSSHTSSPS